MLDFSHIPRSTKADRQIFYATNQSYRTWLKPRGVNFVQITALSAGGGGGAGGPVGNTSGGGGGGGSGSQCRALFPAWALPDVLYIFVGIGGRGGVEGVIGSSADGSGSSGGEISISIYPAITANYVLCRVNGGTGGGVGTAGAAGGAAAGGTVNAITVGPLAGLGVFGWGHAATNISLVGQNSAAGGTLPAGGEGGQVVLPTTGLIVTAGTGGGSVTTSTSFAGGPLTVPAGGIFPLHPGGGAGGVGTTTDGNPGSSGYQAIPNLLCFYGGTGGGCSGNLGGSGGNGGAGGYGCGGGGGGGGRSGTRSQGGRGGDGLVIVTAW